MCDDKNYESALWSAAISNVSMVSNTLICTPSEISQELRHNHDIDHWCDSRIRLRFDFLGRIFWFLIVTA